MNKPDELDSFETALLTELRREVAEHPASGAGSQAATSSPPEGRRRRGRRHRGGHRRRGRA